MNPSIFVSVTTDPTDSRAARETVRYDIFVRRLLKAQPEATEALHIALGIGGEAGEFQDAVKKEYIYGKARDIANIKEELGDLEFYLQCAYNHYNLNRSEVIQSNAEKLEVRYAGLVYSDLAAVNRADKS